MSLQRVTDAHLNYYTGPYFPLHTGPLNVMYGELSWNGSTLDVPCNRVRGFTFQGRANYKTSDGYDWFWGAAFSRDSKIVLVLFPVAQDWEKADGSQLDRSIAFYTRDCGAHQVAELAAELWEAFADVVAAFVPTS